MENIKDYGTFINEAKGIHPAIREKLLEMLKKNPKCSYAEAKKGIAAAVKGWELSKEDFEEAKKLA